MFTQKQLTEIQTIAKSVKNQGELSVYKKLLEKYQMDATSYSLIQWGIIKYCAEECRRQHSEEMSVYDMINAWNYAESIQYVAGYGKSKWVIPIGISFIEQIGILVEPIYNKKGFRTIPIGIQTREINEFGNPVWGWIEKAKWERIPFMLEMLLDSYYSGILTTDALDASNGDPHYRGWNKLSKTAEDQFYFEYENIHPFRDGNGRSGKILYNYLCGTLDNPIMPPNFWGASNP